MPANMRKLAVGARLYVTGRRRATVSAGPTRGRTPTAVPGTAPRKANARLVGLRATPNPWPRAARVSTGLPPVERAPRQGDPEPERKDQIDRHAQEKSDEGVAAPPPRAEPPGGQDEDERGGEGGAERLQERNREGEARQDPGQSAALDRWREARKRPAPEDRHPERAADDDEPRPDEGGEGARPDAGVLRLAGDPAGAQQEEEPEPDDAGGDRAPPGPRAHGPPSR